MRLHQDILSLKVTSADTCILCMAENLRIDEQDCGLDLFAPIDRRYPHCMKKEREKTTARHSSSACGITIF